MSIPTYEEVMLPLLEVIYDGSIYTSMWLFFFYWGSDTSGTRYSYIKVKIK